MKLLERSRQVFDMLAGSPARLPTRIEIPQDHVDDPTGLGEPLAKDKCYFQVRVNEMFLAQKRQWFKTYYPMVYVGTEFLYDREEVAIPFVLGPETLGPAVEVGSEDVVFRNTRVAGVSPYRGGRLSMTLVLYRVEKDDYSRRLLDMVENLAGALDFATAISVYTKIAGSLLDGVQILTGAADTTPVLGHRIEMDPDAHDVIRPGYFAFIDMPDDKLKDYTLWVKDDRLMEGASLEAAQPFRAADFVLTSLVSKTTRSDVDLLPFNDIWQRVLKEAGVPKPASYESARTNLVSLYQTMSLSPDMIREHARTLSLEYADEMVATHEHAVGLSTLSDDDAEDDMAEIRAASLRMLDL